jgi:hypothetical protein
MLINVLISELLEAVPVDIAVFWYMTPWSQTITDVSEDSAAYISTLKKEASPKRRYPSTKLHCATHTQNRNLDYQKPSH